MIIGLFWQNSLEFWSDAVRDFVFWKCCPYLSNSALRSFHPWLNFFLSMVQDFFTWWWWHHVRKKYMQCVIYILGINAGITDDRWTLLTEFFGVLVQCSFVILFFGNAVHTFRTWHWDCFIHDLIPFKMFWAWFKISSHDGGDIMSERNICNV